MSDARQQRLTEAIADYLDDDCPDSAARRRTILDRYVDVADDLLQVFDDEDHALRLLSPLKLMTLPDEAPRLPAEFDGFEPQEELGSGGMGIVFKAWQAELNRFVAVKLIRAGLLASEADVRRFQAEAKLAAGLDHPNIVTIFGTGEHAGHRYLVMQLVEGTNLGDALPRYASHPMAAAELIEKVAHAVDFAHERGVLHRDLKPTNILLDRDGEPQIADFGLAKRLDVDSSLTAEGAPVGTTAYMSPEAINQPGSVDRRTDVYSLGVVLYELLAGRRPFDGIRQRVIEEILHDDPPPPRRIRAGIPRDLETICLTAMAKQPERRYPTAAALADDLRRALRGEPITARPVGTLERAVKWARRRPAVTSLLATLMLVVVTAFAVVTWKWRDAEQRRIQAEQERQRADRNFAWAQAAVEQTMSTLLADRRFREGPFPDLHETLLQSAVDFYEDVMLHQPDEPLLLAGLSDIYWRLGFVQGIQQRHAAALETYRRMERGYRELVRRVPDEVEYRRWLAWSLTCQGNVLRDLERFDEADRRFAEASERFEVLHAQHPDDLHVAILLAGTCLNRGRQANRLERHDEAAPLFRRALTLLEPLDVAAADEEVANDHERFLGETITELTNLLPRLGRCDELAQILERALNRGSDDPRHWYDCAIAHLGADDLPAYRAVCRRMLDRFGNTDDLGEADRILYTLLPVRDSVDDTMQVVRLAQFAYRSGDWNRRLLGAALFRAGRAKDAVQHLEESFAAGTQQGWDMFFLAMAHYEAGNELQARLYLARAQRWTDDTETNDPHATGHRWGWTERLETHHLRTEAEELLTGNNPPQ